MDRDVVEVGKSSAVGWGTLALINAGLAQSKRRSRVAAARREDRVRIQLTERQQLKVHEGFALRWVSRSRDEPAVLRRCGAELR